jgi:hypothetical protein
MPLVGEAWQNYFRIADNSGSTANHRVGISGACIKGNADALFLVATYQH